VAVGPFPVPSVQWVDLGAVGNVATRIDLDRATRRVSVLIATNADPPVLQDGRGSTGGVDGQPLATGYMPIYAGASWDLQTRDGDGASIASIFVAGPANARAIVQID
jgi:hypothetical protein